MPRQVIRRGHEQRDKPLVDELAAELSAHRRYGQPMVEEEHFERTGSVYVRVYWDRWHGVPDERRTDDIFRAYENAIPDTASQIALALGLTIPEA